MTLDVDNKNIEYFLLEEIGFIWDQVESNFTMNADANQDRSDLSGIIKFIIRKRMLYL